MSCPALLGPYLDVGHLALQSDPGLLGQGKLLLVPLPDALQRRDFRLGRLQPAGERCAFQLHLPQLALQGCHLLSQVMHWKQESTVLIPAHSRSPQLRSDVQVRPSLCRAGTQPVQVSMLSHGSWGYRVRSWSQHSVTHMVH